MRCSVLQCVAVCCSVWWCAVNMLLCAAVSCSVVQCAAVCCSVLHCAAVCSVRCSVLQCVVQCDAVYCNMLLCVVPCVGARAGDAGALCAEGLFDTDVCRVLEWVMCVLCVCRESECVMCV